VEVYAKFVQYGWFINARVFFIRVFFLVSFQACKLDELSYFCTMYCYQWFVKVCISSNGCSLWFYKCKKGSVRLRLIAHFLAKGLNKHNSYQTKAGMEIDESNH